ncbi:MAG: P1 family peptidase, partial [Gemmatimonadota bacterium]
MSGRLTDVPGLRVGHAGDHEARTGCTVVLGPFRAAADVRGTATGTRELEAISPLHLVDRADAILLTGGSAFGLAAAGGVAAWLEEQGDYGFDTGVARVPIVPAAVLFDLAVGRSDRRPDAAMGRAACMAAGHEVAEG